MQIFARSSPPPPKAAPWRDRFDALKRRRANGLFSGLERASLARSQRFRTRIERSGENREQALRGLDPVLSSYHCIVFEPAFERALFISASDRWPLATFRAFFAPRVSPTRPASPRPLGVIEAITAARDQCPNAAVREHAGRALAAVKGAGPEVLREQAFLVLSTLAGWRGDRALQVKQALRRFLDETGGTG